MAGKKDSRGQCMIKILKNIDAAIQFIDTNVNGIIELHDVGPGQYMYKSKKYFNTWLKFQE